MRCAGAGTLPSASRVFPPPASSLPQGAGGGSAGRPRPVRASVLPQRQDAQGPVHGADELRGRRDLCLSLTLPLGHPHAPCLAPRGVAGLRKTSEPGVQLGLTVCYLPDVQPEPGVLFCCLLLSCVCEIWPLSVSAPAESWCSSPRAALGSGLPVRCGSQAHGWWQLLGTRSSRGRRSPPLRGPRLLEASVPLSILFQKCSSGRWRAGSPGKR